MRVINADKYMERLRANIDTTADTVAEQLKRDEPCGTVKDGGQIGYLWALQWARNALELDYYTVQAIPIPDNATNGDMIKAMFPKGKVRREVSCTHDKTVFSFPDGTYFGAECRFNTDWWNAPYRAESEDKDENNN